MESAHGAFLGVEHSVRGMQWRERLEGAAVNTAVAISQRYGLPELLGRVLAGDDRYRAGGDRAGRDHADAAEEPSPAH